MHKIALLGAGGKMGQRLTANLIGSPFDVRHVEISERGQQGLRRSACSGLGAVLWHPGHNLQLLQ